MAFTREQMAEYEKRPQTQVPDQKPPFETKSAPPVATPPADEVEDELIDDTDDSATPSDAAAVPDPDDQGDGTSDDNADPSTAPADPSGETDTTDEDEPVAPPPKKGSARERIQELVEERDGFKAYGSYAQEQLAAKDRVIAELKSKVGSTTPAATASAPAADEPEEPMPTLEDADVAYDMVAYNRKMAKWTNAQIAKSVKKAVAEVIPSAAPKAEVKDPVEDFKQRFALRAEKDADFKAAVATPLPQFSEEASLELISAEDGLDLLHYLAKRKAEAVRIAGLSKNAQLMEFGAIRAKLLASKAKPVNTTTSTAGGTPKPTAKPKSPSNAPPPPTRIAGGGRSQAPDPTDPAMSMDDFAAKHRAERNAAKQRNRELRGLR